MEVPEQSYQDGREYGLDRGDDESRGRPHRSVSLMWATKGPLMTLPTEAMALS